MSGTALEKKQRRKRLPEVLKKMYFKSLERKWKKWRIKIEDWPKRAENGFPTCVVVSSKGVHAVPNNGQSEHVLSI